MAPVLKSIVEVCSQSQLDKAERSMTDGYGVKDELSDEDACQDEDFKGWDATVMKEKQENNSDPQGRTLLDIADGKIETNYNCMELNVEVEVSTSSSIVEPACSKEESYSEPITPRLMICESFDSEPSENTQVVSSRKSSEGRGSKQDNHFSRKHQCSECGKTFPQASKLVQHLKIHSTEKPFHCVDCGKCFAMQQHLDWHSRIHKEGSCYCCPVCFRKYTGQTSLSRHLLKNHPDEKPYKCCECGSPFVQASALKRHLKVHDSSMAREEMGRVDSMFLIQENNLSAIDDFQKNKEAFKSVEEKASEKEFSPREPKCKLIMKDGEENNLPRTHQHDKHVKKTQFKNIHQKRQLTEIGAKLKRIKSFISSEEQKGRSVLGAQIHNGHFESPKDLPLLGKDKSDLLGKKSVSSDKLPLKGNGSNMDCRLHSKGEDLDRNKQNQGRCGKSGLNDTISESFSCRNCGENFRSKASLYNHVMCHIGMKLHDCSMCGKHFSETLSLERHYIYHITGSFPQECLRCGRHFFSYHDLRDHSQTHLAEKKRRPRVVDKFKCNKCRRNFPSFSILEVHIRSRCHEDRRPGKSGSSTIKASKVKNRENSNSRMVVDVDPHVAFPAEGYCSDSSVKDETGGSERFHNSHHPSMGGEDAELSSDEAKQTSTSSSNGETEAHSLGLLDCAECGKKVAGIEAMLQHIKEHVAERTNLKCPVVKCGKLFRDSKDFQAHIRAHAGEKPYNCSQCGKSFYLKENYDKHMSRHDTWGSIATIIGESSSSVESVKRDSSEGSYEKQRHQNVTHAPSSHKEYLNSGKEPPPLFMRHSVIVSKSQDQSPPPLKQMGQAAPTPVITTTSKNSGARSYAGHTQKERMCASALVQLFRVSDSANALHAANGDFRRYPRSGQCEVCLKFCSRLDKHMMVHLNQKPHLCPMCPQAFRQSEHLKRHVRARHEGNHRVFECSLCFKRLTRKDKLKEHMRNCRKFMSPMDSPISNRLFDVIPGPSRLI